MPLPPPSRRLRSIGFDDAPFERGSGRGLVPVAGVICAGTRFEGMVWGQVRRDGWNATDVLVSLLAGGKFLPQLHLVLLDGITLGGFNVVDLPALATRLRRPCIAVMRRPPDLEAMARAGVAAGLLPTSTLYLKCPAYAPGRALVAAGLRLCLGSNVNPGSAMTESFSLALGLACLGNGLRPAEAFLAATADGAAALRLADRGRLVPGLLADLVVHGASDVDHLAYHLATTHVRAVVKAGRLVHEAPHLPARCV